MYKKEVACMKWLYKMGETFSYGVDSFLMRDVEPAVVNYTHFTCVVAELLLLWKVETPQTAMFFTVIFLLHLYYLFKSGYLKGQAYGAEEQLVVKRYQRVEAVLIFYGAVVQPKAMLCYVLFSYGLPYVMAQVVEFLMTVPVDEYLEYVVFVLLRVVVWAPAVAFGILFAYIGFDLLWTGVGLFAYFSAIPFVISFEDDYASLYEIAFNRVV